MAGGRRVRALAHRPGREHLLASQGIEVRYGEVTDADSVREAVEGVDGVVHLAAIIRERGGLTLDQVNHLGTRNVAVAAKEAGARCLVYLGAIGVRDEPRFPYFRSKWRAEQAVIASGVPYTILRASIQFGEGDEFINTLAGVIKAFPVVPVAGDGRPRFQPIAVEDVAECIAQTLDREKLRGQMIEVGGPKQLTYDEIIESIAKTYRLRRLKAHVPLAIMRRIVWTMEKTLPYPPATLHQLAMLAIDNITQLDALERVFGFRPRPLEDNIDYIHRITLWDALRISLGFMPKHIRDH